MWPATRSIVSTSPRYRSGARASSRRRCPEPTIEDTVSTSTDIADAQPAERGRERLRFGQRMASVVPRLLAREIAIEIHEHGAGHMLLFVFPLTPRHVIERESAVGHNDFLTENLSKFSCFDQ